MPDTNRKTCDTCDTPENEEEWLERGGVGELVMITECTLCPLSLCSECRDLHRDDHPEEEWFELEAF